MIGFSDSLFKRNYNKTPFLAHQWKVFKAHFRITPLVTIFGYSAPSTDVEARKILKEVWGTPNQRKLEEIEFIDLKQKEQLREEWKEFIHSHHYRNYSSFYESYVATFPRRSIEACNREILLGEVLDYNPPPHFTSLQELRDFMRPLQEEETMEAVNSMKKWKKICP